MPTSPSSTDRGISECFALLCVFVVWLVALPFGSSRAEDVGECLRYDALVILTGTMLMRKVELGRDLPAWASVPYAVLRLDKPISCVAGKDEKTERRVSTLHVLDPCNRIWPRGSRVSVTGELFPRTTMHHYTPVLIMAKTVKRLNGTLPTCQPE
jgi:hypothetical protein